MTFLFTPPTVEEGPAGAGPLFARYKLSRGVTVLVTGGVCTETRYPTQDELDAADAYYVGGHVHEVPSGAVASALLAAGYALTRSGTGRNTGLGFGLDPFGTSPFGGSGDFPDSSLGFGLGPFGTSPFGG